MSQTPRPHGPTSSSGGQPHPGGLPEGGGDPWAAFGYIVAGVAVYGLIGWGLSVWLHARFLIAAGIIVGAALGLILVFYTFGRVPGGSPTRHRDDDAESLQEQNAPHDRGETE